MSFNILIKNNQFLKGIDNKGLAEPVQPSSYSWSANAGTLDPFNSALEFYYQLEDETDLMENHDLTESGGTTFVAGKQNDCASFSTSRLTAANNANFDLSTATDWLIDTWYKTTTTSSGVLMCNYSASNQYQWQLRASSVMGQHNLYWEASTNGTGQTTSCSSNFGPSYLDNTWRHLAVGGIGGVAYMFINGSQQTADIANLTGLFSADSFQMGGTHDVNHQYPGETDESAFWRNPGFADLAEMQSVVSARYNSGTGAYLS